MGDVVYRSEIALTRDRGPLRTATMPGGESVEFGVHGAIAEHYGVSMENFSPVSTTVVYVRAPSAISNQMAVRW